MRRLGSSLRLALVTLALVTLALGALGAATAACGVLGGGAEPEVVATFESSYVVGGIEDDGSLVVAVSASDGPFFTDLVRLDADTGEQIERTPLVNANSIEGVASFGESLVLRTRGRVPEVPAAEATWPRSGLREGELWLVVVDGDELEPVRQYQLAPLDEAGDRSHYRRADEPLVLVDGVYWMLGVGTARGPLDLRSGEYGAAPTDAFGGIRSVHVLDDELLVVRFSRVRAFDLATGSYTLDHGIGDLTRGLSVGFRYHDDQLWLGGSEPEDWEQVYRYDPVTISMTDARPAADIPYLSFDSGGFRWELWRDEVIPEPLSSYRPRDGDRWRQVDPATGETIDEFDFGEWRPRWVDGRHLYLTRDLDGGLDQELGRVALG